MKLSYKRKGRRFARCRECGREWNIGISDKVPKFGYICPECKKATLGRQSLSGKQKQTIFNLTQDKERVKNG